jgi:ribosomal protein S18 acetylase RimI-like enzyme
MTPAPIYDIRSAGNGDIESLLSFWALAAENTGRVADDARSLTRLLARDADALLLAESGDGIVGSVIAGWDGWRFHIYRLAVHPDWRGRGVGRQLIAEVESRAASAGASRIDAVVLVENERAAAFWTALGYRPQPEWRRWVRQVDR